MPRAAAILGAPCPPVNVMLRKSIWSSRTAHPEQAGRGGDLSLGFIELLFQFLAALAISLAFSVNS